MKTSLEWLSEYLPNPLEGQRAADALTDGGLPVELIEKHGNDTVIDVEVTNNRPDCLCHIGIARELAALLKAPFKEPAVSVAESSPNASHAISVAIEAPEVCPHYTARVIRGVKVGPSPAWMARRLEAVGLRPVNNVVDVTNYVMLEMGQPLHAFDYDRIAGHRIIVRVARGGETIVSIDGKTRELQPWMLVIADERRPVALAGVMGGAESEVSPGTSAILLESARFDALSVRRTARALAMKSDSSYRFERGIDPTLPVRASLRAAELILKTAGGTLLRGVVQAGAEDHQGKRITLRLSTLRRVLGIEFPLSQVMDALARLGLSPAARTESIDVTVPSHRLDLNKEIDLVEEAARVIGYASIPIRQEISLRLTPPDRQVLITEAIGQVLVAGGYFEAVTFSFVSDSLRRDFLPGGEGAMLRADAAVRKADASLRPSLIPGLLEVVRHNETAGTLGTRFFEIGSVFGVGPTGKMIEQRKIGLVGSGDYREVRGVVESVLHRLDSNRTVEVRPEDHAGFASGAAGRIFWGGQTVGILGKIDAPVLEKVQLRQAPAAAELDMEPLLAGARPAVQFAALPRFPAVRRDLSLIVPDSIPYQRIDALIAGLQLPLLETAEYVTTYRGKPLEAGTKSVTVTLVFRSPETTLTSQQVDSSVEAAIAAAKAELGAAVRN